MRSSKETKEKIFFSAVELFAKNGFKSVSMRDIAREAGIKPASIYNHYKSKELILDDILNLYLERMEIFYNKINGPGTSVDSGQTLAQHLERLMLTYEPEEIELMYRLTRIVYHEQFHSIKAADALIGNGYRKYMEEHVRYFDKLSDAGFIHGKSNNRYYGELFARMSLTFATQFLHPEVQWTMKDQSEMYNFLIPLVVSNEARAAVYRKETASPAG